MKLISRETRRHLDTFAQHHLTLARAGDLNAQTFIQTFHLFLPFEMEITINYFENYLSTFPFYVGY